MNIDINKINVKKIIGVNVNKNMSVDLLITKLSKAKNIDFAENIIAAKGIVEMVDANISLFSSTQKLEEELKITQDKLSVAVNTYNKANSLNLGIIDKIPVINGSPINSQISTTLTPLSNGLEETKKQIDKMAEAIAKNYQTMKANTESIRAQGDAVKESMMNKIVDYKPI